MLSRRTVENDTLLNVVSVGASSRTENGFKQNDIQILINKEENKKREKKTRWESGELRGVVDLCRAKEHVRESIPCRDLFFYASFPR